MPTFDFQCKKCDNVFEFARPFGSDEKPACPHCGSKRTEKLLAPPAVHFKGSGWYKTDSQKSSTGNLKKKEQGKIQEAKVESAPTAEVKDAKPKNDPKPETPKKP